MVWAIARWSIAIAAIVCGLISLNHAIFATWATIAPPGGEFNEVRIYQAYRLLGYSVAFLAAAVLVMINFRRGLPHLRNKWTAFLLIVAALGLVSPRMQHFLKVDGCLDQGGSWNYDYEICDK